MCVDCNSTLAALPIMDQDKPKQSAALLEAKLEASEAKLKILELSQRIQTLETVVSDQSKIIKENTALLRKQRLPTRPYLSAASKVLIACRQQFKCSDPFNTCPCYKLGDGTFHEDLGIFEIDHIQPIHMGGVNHNNTRAVCVSCHAKLTRKMVLERAERAESETEEEDD